MSNNHLRPITQMAFEANDAERKMEELQRLGAKDWVLDLVTARHLFTEKGDVGLDFMVKLCFNYDLVEPKFDPEKEDPQKVELEFISVVRGQTCNVRRSEGALAHLGYQVNDLAEELTRMKGLGFRVNQISQTVHHTGPHEHLYRYAYFLCGTLGCHLKAYQKIAHGKRRKEEVLAEAQSLFGHMG